MVSERLSQLRIQQIRDTAKVVHIDVVDELLSHIDALEFDLVAAKAEKRNHIWAVEQLTTRLHNANERLRLARELADEWQQLRAAFFHDDPFRTFPAMDAAYDAYRAAQTETTGDA